MQLCGLQEQSRHDPTLCDIISTAGLGNRPKCYAVELAREYVIG